MGRRELGRPAAPRVRRRTRPGRFRSLAALLTLGGLTLMSGACASSALRRVPAFTATTLVGPSNSYSSLAVDRSGIVYATSELRNDVLRITPDGTVTGIAGAEAAGFADGPAASARFSHPSGLAVDGNGTLYIADTGNDRIRTLSPTGSVTTLAGSGVKGAADGPGAQAPFWDPHGLALAADGTLYVADTGNQVLRTITPDGRVATLSLGVSPAAAPMAVAVDRSGTVYVADPLQSQIVEFRASGAPRIRLRVAHAGLRDGGATVAAVARPTGIAVDATGTVYVADTGNGLVRRLTPDGQLRTVAGVPPVPTPFDGRWNQPGFQGPAAAAPLARLSAVAVGSTGVIYVADPGTSSIRLLRRTR